jgi:CheY-like chemotaxis protein
MSKHILHIDDEEAIRDIVAELLTQQGYQVTSAASPTEALVAARNVPPDLIISDLQLDEADGFETIARLRELNSAVPVILLTGVLIDPLVAQETVGRLVSSYLEKTRPLAEIVREVDRLIGPGR